MIIGMAGKTASGKTTIARLFEERMGAFRIKYSDLLADMAKERGLNPKDKATLQNLFLTEREQRGEDFLSKEMEHRASSLSAPLVVIEGNRRLGDIDTLRHIAQNKKEKLLLLFIDALLPVRFTRYNSRLEEEGLSPISMEAFLELENNGAESEIPQILEIFKKEGLVLNADTKTPDELFEEIRKTL